MVNFFNEESGQALTEYALILGLIFIICVVVVTTLGLSIRNVLYPTEIIVETVGAQFIEPTKVTLVFKE